jgi:hypothetical protein
MVDVTPGFTSGVTHLHVLVYLQTIYSSFIAGAYLCATHLWRNPYLRIGFRVLSFPIIYITHHVFSLKPSNHLGNELIMVINNGWNLRPWQFLHLSQRKRRYNVACTTKVEDRSGGVSFFYMIRTLTRVKPTINSVVSIMSFHALSLVGGCFTWVQLGCAKSWKW